LWIGDRLGAVERACLRSVCRQGHRLALYCYDRPAGVPDEVEVRDADPILPRSEMQRFPGSKVAIFSDWFRYALLEREAGVWVDTDVYLLAPLVADGGYLFGEQDAGLINNAVLRLPPHSPMLRDLLEIFERRKTPQWLSWRAYLQSRFRESISGRADPGRMPWGTTGPHALTALTKRHRVEGLALPALVLNPVPWTSAGWIRDPALRLEDMVTNETIAIHLWNACIKGFKDEPAAEGSFLDRLHREGRD